MRRPSPLGAIFVTVLIDLLSFGLVIPDIQIRGDSLGASGWVRGLLLATFSIAQLLTAPYLGRLSDSIGRRMILLLTTVLSVICFVFYAHAETLLYLFISRVISGIAGANLPVAYAYVADVTKPEDRAKGMGLLGAAFGVGFIFGPVLGGVLLEAGGGKPLLMGYVAAAMAAVNFLYVFFFLPESLMKEDRTHADDRKPTLHNMKVAFATPGLGLLLAMFFAYNFAFSNLESTYFLLVVKNFLLTQREGTYLLAIVGIVSAVMQGFMVQRATKRFGELNLVRISYLFQVPTLMAVPFAMPWIPQIIGIIFLGTCTGLSQPSLNSLISKSAPRDMQGGIFGVTQALGAFARILGPMVGNALYDVRYWLPYTVAGSLVLFPLLGAFRMKSPPEPEPAPAT
ncbi:MAG: MFS transporter [Fimbriimonadaceae bacterium]|nr:MFS transporter [Fimbriimonadaceae bacterium]